MRAIPLHGGDLNNRGDALNFPKGYPKDLDSQMIPLFVVGISEAIDSTPSNAASLVLLLEALARAHGHKIAPHIDILMSVVMRTLSTGPWPCSNVVSAIVEYGIDPSAADAEKTAMIRSVCKPLSDALMSFDDNVSDGAAVCLKDVAHHDIWRFASNETVNGICLKVAGALEEARTQTGSHICLATVLAERNIWLLEAYARSLVRSGLQILSSGVEDSASDKCISAIQMITSLIRRVDSRTVSSEIESIIEIMEKFQNDQSPLVQAAAFEALKTANVMAARESGSDLNESSWGSYESLVGSSLSTGHSSHPRHPIRRMWNTETDVKAGATHDCLFLQPGLDCGVSSSYFEHRGNSKPNEEIRRFMKASMESPSSSFSNVLVESNSCSPKRTTLIGDGKMISTSRKMPPSLNDSNAFDPRSYGMQDCSLLSCPSANDEVEASSDGAGFDCSIHRRPNSDEQNTGKELRIQSFDNNSLAISSLKPYSRAAIEETQSAGLGNMGFWKTQSGLICSFTMFVLAIALLISLIKTNEVRFDVFPT